jgi:hypothetical protein
MRRSLGVFLALPVLCTVLWLVLKVRDLEAARPLAKVSDHDQSGERPRSRSSAITASGDDPRPWGGDRPVLHRGVQPAAGGVEEPATSQGQDEIQDPDPGDAGPSLRLPRSELVERRFIGEPMDPAWAREVSYTVQGALERHLSGVASLSNVRCRSTTCAVDVQHPGRELPRLGLGRSVQELKESTGRRVSLSFVGSGRRGADGSTSGRYYLRFSEPKQGPPPGAD